MISYFLRQAAFAFTVVAGLLLLAEILLPGSVLPFFNLHAFVFAVIGLHALTIAMPSDEAAHVALRLPVVIPIALLLLAAVWLLIWGPSASAMLLSVALGAVVLAAAAAIAFPRT